MQETSVKPNLSPTGKVALVTGAGNGIGRASALAFARQGTRVIVADIHAEDANQTVEMIHKAGGEAVFIKTDVSKAEQAEALVLETVKIFGRLDYAHNNAGILGEKAFAAVCSEQNWDRTLAVNLKGVWLCMKYEILQMLKQKGGSIVNTASVAGLVGFYKLPAYAASKHGIIGLTKTAALEYARRGIRINAVCPGLIDTQMIERSVMESPSEGDDLVERRAIQSYLERSVPIRRMGKAEEVADVVTWLCSDAAAYVTGHALPVDGAYVAQ